MSKASKYLSERSEDKSKNRMLLYQIMPIFLNVCQY